MQTFDAWSGAKQSTHVLYTEHFQVSTNVTDAGSKTLELWRS